MINNIINFFKSAFDLRKEIHRSDIAKKTEEAIKRINKGETVNGTNVLNQKIKYVLNQDGLKIV